MRRLLREDPVTYAGRYGYATAAVAIVVSAIGLLMVRDARVETGPALAVLIGGLGLAAVAVTFAVFAFVRVWRDGARGLGAAVTAVFVAGSLLAYPTYAAVRGLRLPALTDITTDTEQPPAFSRSAAAFAAREGRYPDEPPAATRDAQRAVYTQIAPLTLDVAPEEAFELVRRAAVNRRWQIIEAIRPGGRIGNGRIDAIARSRLLNLPADITVRVRPRADGARIDVRSATRLGNRDFGDNADRVRSFLDEVANLAIALK